MRKVFLSAAVLMVGGLMLHGAFACEVNRQVSQPNWAIVLPDACSWSNCLVDPPQAPLTSDPAQDCGAAYFDPGTYSGSNGLLEWLMASLVTESPYKPGEGFAPSPPDWLMVSLGTQSQYKPGAGFAPSPLDWLMASLGTESQYKPGAGFAPPPMDANAQYRKLRKTSAPLEPRSIAAITPAAAASAERAASAAPTGGRISIGTRGRAQ
jgi:hypothetical protein